MRLKPALFFVSVAALAALAIYVAKSNPGRSPPPQPEPELASRRAADPIMLDLLEAIQRQDVTRANALEDELADLNDASAGALAKALALPAENATEIEYQMRVAAALGKIGGTQALQGLSDALASHASEQVRGQVLLGLSLIQSEKVPPLLGGVLLNKNEAPSLRRSAALFLAKRPEPEGTRRLLDALRSQQEPELTLWILESLGFSTDPNSAAPVLSEFLSANKAENQRAQAATALIALLKENSAPYVAGVLKNDSSAVVRRRVVSDLAPIAAKPPISELLQTALRGDADPGVRALAASSLGAGAPADALPALERCFKIEADIYVKLKIIEAAGRLASPEARTFLTGIATGDARSPFGAQARTELLQLKKNKARNAASPVENPK